MGPWSRHCVAKEIDTEHIRLASLKIPIGLSFKDIDLSASYMILKKYLFNYPPRMTGDSFKINLSD